MTTYNANDLADILRDMADYIDCEDCKEQKTEYFKEIVQSGLFHDAVGKIAEDNGDSVLVATEY